MKITVPKDIGGDLKILPEGPCEATLTELFLGKSTSSGHAKVTAKYVITSEMDIKGQKAYDAEGEEVDFPEDFSTIGEVVLETFSLQPHALFGLNSLYKSVAGRNLPQGDYEPEELVDLLKEELIPREFKLILEVDQYQGKIMTKVAKRSFMR
jgi:hypothetical protein